MKCDVNLQFAVSFCVLHVVLAHFHVVIVHVRIVIAHVRIVIVHVCIMIVHVRIGAHKAVCSLFVGLFGISFRVCGHFHSRLLL